MEIYSINELYFSLLKFIKIYCFSYYSVDLLKLARPQDFFALCLWSGLCSGSIVIEKNAITHFGQFVQ